MDSAVLTKKLRICNALNCLTFYPMEWYLITNSNRFFNLSCILFRRGIDEMADSCLFDEDSLELPEVGIWSEKKYSLIKIYAEIFATAMKYKWDCRVYIDLYAGAGRAKIKGTERIVDTSPLLALDIRDKFDVYIFCDKEPYLINALEKRVKSRFGGSNKFYICGDVNRKVLDVVKKIPKPSRDYRVLSFCVVDPFKLANLKFSTIETLSKYYIDFFVLVPTDMDAHRNVSVYEKPNHMVVSEFLGNANWRREWGRAKESGTSFSIFIMDAFSKQMERLKYLPTKIYDSELIREPKRNAPLYRLALYSRDKLGKKLWDESRKCAEPQLELPFSWE